MTEQLLQYLWHHKLIKAQNLVDTQGFAVKILNFGTWNTNAGPDFLLAKIEYQGLILVGHIEFHLRSSDYLKHQHQHNPQYDNLILHAVYEHDETIEVLAQKNIPTIALKPYIDGATLNKYQKMMTAQQGIPCEGLFDKNKIPPLFSDELLLKKLDEKATQIEHALTQTKNDYEAVLFRYLAYAFGLKINAEIFQQLAEGLDFSIINKVRQRQTQLEALFFGLCGWLEKPEDPEMGIWKREFDFLKAKYQLPERLVSPLFLRLRPPNFPTIRLSQLAHLYATHQHLFSKVIEAQNLNDLYTIFQPISASAYWDKHYTFGKTTPEEKPKKLSAAFIHLILINAVLPLRYAYFKNQKENISDDILNFYQEIPAEHNSIITYWKRLGVHFQSAKDTQAFLFLKKIFCNHKKCLTCSIGYQLLKP
ncbi:DUF2851 family protein [Riemerella columbina]|uniref:DUF2851 family protein n=1 Tax=Riemerella columbina TaxID=103810 RepID=UPI0026703BE5|nr:DUF2851 family protein [Riemerella columbina]WKS95131.1 DUF2851 family protein [Riemerella columbina]